MANDDPSGQFPDPASGADANPIIHGRPTKVAYGDLTDQEKAERARMIKEMKKKKRNRERMRGGQREEEKVQE